MIETMFAEVFLQSWSIGQIAIAVVILAGLIAIVFIGLRAMGIQPPPWVLQIGWVLIIVFVVVLAIKILLSMW